jgi:hypothetical protein
MRVLGVGVFVQGLVLHTMTRGRVSPLWGSDN